MTRFLVAVAMLLSLAVDAGAQQLEQRTTAFDAVCKTVEETFYDPSFLGVDWAGVCRQSREHLHPALNMALDLAAK